MKVFLIALFLVIFRILLRYEVWKDNEGNYMLWIRVLCFHVLVNYANALMERNRLISFDLGWY